MFILFKALNFPSVHYALIVRSHLCLGFSIQATTCLSQDLGFIYLFIVKLCGVHTHTLCFRSLHSLSH